MKRTKAIEILESLKAVYELREFEASEFTTQEVASKLKVSHELVYKTLVVQGIKKGVVMAVVPGPKELSLKKFAAVLGDKKCDLVPVKDLPRLTGYQKGGCSPLGSKKKYPVYIDNSASNLENILVSAGLRGLQLFISPKVLVSCAEATFADIAE